MSKQREALQMALDALEDYQANGAPFFKCDSAVAAIREALAEPELEFWPGDVLICKEDGTKVTVVHGNRGAMRLMNGKIAVAWNDNVGGEYTIEQIKEMFYQDEKPEPEQKPVAYVDANYGIMRISGGIDLPIGATLYTAPPARKPLTDAEIFNTAADYYEGYGFKALEFARAIERAHGIE